MDDDYNAAWNAGYRTAVGVHAGLVAAVQGLLDGQALRDYEFGDDRHIQLTLTLESALNNLTTILVSNECGGR